jgi:O-antigen/teichoic acid export membrane protein
MSSNDELSSFVRDALARGVPRARVDEALRSAGWTAEQARGALASFADVEFPIPVPRPKPYLSAREAFMYLVLFSTLYVSAFNVGSLLFEMIERAFPDTAVQRPDYVGYDFSRERVRWAVASLIVSFPVFLFMSRLLARAVGEDPNKRNSKVRRWLTYLTLFVSAGVLIGDLTMMIYNFLGGELGIRFALKAAVVGAIAGSIFGYYLTELRREEIDLR